MNETTFEPALIEATQNLPGCLSTCLSVSHFINSKWQGWKNYSYDADSNSLSLCSPTECELDYFKNAVESYAPGIISVINRHLHLFANISDVVDLSISPDKSNDVMEVQAPETHYSVPGNIIGTSAHHAGILFLEAALNYDFWFPNPIEDNWYFPPSFNKDWILAKLHWERLRLFIITDPTHKEGNLSGLGMLLEPEEPESHDVVFHDSTQDITQEYYDQHGQLPDPLKGNKTELYNAVMGTDPKRPGKMFADLVTRRAFYVVKIAPREYELYFPQDRHSSLAECRDRLEKRRSKTVNN